MRRLVLILAGSLFYSTVSIQKMIVPKFFVPLCTNYLSYQSSIHYYKKMHIFSPQNEGKA